MLHVRMCDTDKVFCHGHFLIIRRIIILYNCNYTTTIALISNNVPFTKSDGNRSVFMN